MSNIEFHPSDIPCLICGGKLEHAEKQGIYAEQFRCGKCGVIPARRVMSTPNGDSPAFPQPFLNEPNKGQYGQYTQSCDIGFGGLTKREEIAKAALQGLLADPDGGTLNVTNYPAALAEVAVKYADALLAELSRVKKD